MRYLDQAAMRVVRHCLLSGVAVAGLAHPAAAFAQDAGEPEMAQPASDTYGANASGNEIVVTATKREVTLQDVPVAVSVASSETIRRAQVRDIQDLQVLVPALRVVQLQSSAATNFFIRGFGNGSNNVGIEPSVGVFIDGVYRSRTASQVSDFPDIRRVEVLRGPQSTLFGKNASAGVISIVTQEPQFKFGGSLDASVGNFNATVLKGHITGPVSEQIALSLAAGYNNRDGYVRDLGSNSRTNERNRWFVRGQALIEPSSDLKIRLIADYDKVDENCCAVVNLKSSAATGAIMLLGGKISDPAHPYADEVWYNFPSTNKFKNYGFSGQVDYTMGPITFTSITALRKTKTDTDQDSDFTSAQLLDHNAMQQGLRTFTQEFRMSGSFLDKLNFLLGAFYLNEKVDQQNLLVFGKDFRSYADLQVRAASGNALNVGLLEGALGQLDAFAAGDPTLAGRYLGQFFGQGRGLTDDYRLKNDALSLYGQLDFEVMDRLTLTVGGNYTHDKKKFRTNVVSDEVFSQVDLDAPQYAPFREQLLLGGGLARAGVDPTDPAAVFAFATNPATAPIFQQIAGYAAGNKNNPQANPLGGLRSLQLFPAFLNVPNAVEPGKTRDSNFSYTIRLAYDLSDSINTYVSYATGFKASSINLSRDSRPPIEARDGLIAGGLVPANLRYGSRFADPEKSRVMELGAKGSWRNVTANLAVFKQALKGFQANIFTGTGFALSNAGKATTWGVEFDGSVRPVDQLTLGVSAVWLHAKYNSYVRSAVGDMSGRRATEVPRFSGTFSGEWDQPVGPDGHLILRAAYHYESKAWAVEGLPGFITRDLAGNAADYSPAFDAARPFQRQVDELDASVTYAFGNGVEMSVWGRNLLDDRYLNRVFDSVAQPGAISGYTNTPRTYGVSARLSW
jgi:outer membrane receptor protein involved in Fe transport